MSDDLTFASLALDDLFVPLDQVLKGAVYRKGRSKGKQVCAYRFTFASHPNGHWDCEEGDTPIFFDPSLSVVRVLKSAAQQHAGSMPLLEV